MRLRASVGELIFTLCLLVCVLILAVFSFSYRPESRLFPNLIIVPLIVFLVLRVVSMIIPKLSKRIEPESGVFDVDKLRRSTETTRELNPKERARREFRVISWIMSLIPLVYVLGILPALAIFVFLFITIYGGKNFLTSAALTIATWVSIYFLFVIGLKVHLYPGILRIPFLG